MAALSKSALVGIRRGDRAGGHLICQHKRKDARQSRSTVSRCAYVLRWSTHIVAQLQAGFHYRIVSNGIAINH